MSDGSVCHGINPAVKKGYIINMVDKFSFMLYSYKKETSSKVLQ